MKYQKRMSDFVQLLMLWITEREPTESNQTAMEGDDVNRDVNLNSAFLKSMK